MHNTAPLIRAWPLLPQHATHVQHTLVPNTLQQPALLNKPRWLQPYNLSSEPCPSEQLEHAFKWSCCWPGAAHPPRWPCH